MKLFLASEAKNPESLEKLRQFVGGSFKDLKISYIPTAANGEFYGSWKGGGSIKAVQSLGVNINIVELEDMAFSNVLERIGQPNIIWFAGGRSGYLLYWIRRAKLDKVLPKLLAMGTIYVGSSAGTMVASKTQYVNEIYIDEEEPGASVIPGLGLVDFEIYPHFEDELLPEIKKRWKKGKVYLLKNGEAITVVDGKVSVLGEERIIEK